MQRWGGALLNLGPPAYRSPETLEGQGIGQILVSHMVVPEARKEMQNLAKLRRRLQPTAESP
jgi:hypothetical protein